MYTWSIGSYTSIEGLGQGQGIYKVYQEYRILDYTTLHYTSIEWLGQGQGVYQVYQEYMILH